MNTTETLDTALEAARKGRGLTYAELGDALGCSEMSAWRYCLPPGDRNHREPRDREVRKRLKDRFGLTVDTFAEPARPKRRKP